MTYGKLSQPLLLIGSNSFEIFKEAERKFNDIFLKKDARPYYNGKFIFFDMNKVFRGQILHFPERFMHICSIEDKDTYNIFPCNNDLSYTLCNNKCNISHALEEFQKIDRNECLYRASRIHWIPEIIRLANQKDKNIKTWTKPERDKKGNLVKKHYIRYEEESVDYLIILKEEWRSGSLSHYKFNTAFPVFLKGNKRQYERDFKKYGNKQVNAPSK
jgi:ribosomal protein L44E